MRKPIQLMDFDGYLHALCDDGTIWMMGSSGWSRIETIPQDEPTVSDLVEALPSVVPSKYRPRGIRLPLWVIGADDGSARPLESEKHAYSASLQGLVIIEADTASWAEHSAKHDARNLESDTFDALGMPVRYLISLPF